MNESAEWIMKTKAQSTCEINILQKWMMNDDWIIKWNESKYRLQIERVKETLNEWIHDLILFWKVLFWQWTGSGPKWPKCFHAKKPTLLHSWGLRLLSPFDLGQDVPHCVSLWKLGVLCFSPAWVPSSFALPNAKQRETSHHPGEGWGRRPLKTTDRWLDWWTDME